MTEPLLQVTDLAVFRGERCLFAELNLAIGVGQVVQLHGENGSGKTSLIRALCTLLPVERGTISWRGNPLPGAQDQYLAEIFYSGHTEAIKSELTPRENLAFTSALLDSAPDKVEQALQRVGLALQADLPCRVLSAGQRRRVSLARLIISDAVLWLLDEPLTALDAHGRQLVESLIEEHVNSGGAVIFTTHQPLASQTLEVSSIQLDPLSQRYRSAEVPAADD